MQFLNQAQQECYQRIQPWLEETFGEYLLRHPSRPEFAVTVGSALAQITLTPFRDDVLICTRAYVVRGAQLDYALLDFLLRENHSILVGSFGVDPAGDVFFQHSILGSTCDAPELESSVTAVALLADSFDDRIVERWGGERAVDSLPRAA